MKKLQTFQHIAAVFEQQPPRERLLMLIASFVITFFLIDTLLVTPQTKRFKQLTSKTESLREDTDKAAQQISTLSAKLALNSDVNKKTELDKLIKQIATTDALLSEEDGNPLHLSALLTSLLETTPGLRLISLRTLPVLPLLPRAALDTDGKPVQKPAPTIIAGTAAETAQVATVYQHGVEIVIKGNYLALLPYLKKINKYPKRLFWIEAKLEVAKYPDAVLRLNLQTLTTQKVTTLR